VPGRTRGPGLPPRCLSSARGPPSGLPRWRCSVFRTPPPAPPPPVPRTPRRQPAVCRLVKVLAVRARNSRTWSHPTSLRGGSRSPRFRGCSIVYGQDAVLHATSKLPSHPCPDDQGADPIGRNPV
jgi:hypothetical protein